MTQHLFKDLFAKAQSSKQKAENADDISSSVALNVALY